MDINELSSSVDFRCVTSGSPSDYALSSIDDRSYDDQHQQQQHHQHHPHHPVLMRCVWNENDELQDGAVENLREQHQLFRRRNFDVHEEVGSIFDDQSLLQLRPSAGVEFGRTKIRSPLQQQCSSQHAASSIVSGGGPGPISGGENCSGGLMFDCDDDDAGSLLMLVDSCFDQLQQCDLPAMSSRTQQQQQQLAATERFVTSATSSFGALQRSLPSVLPSPTSAIPTAVEYPSPPSAYTADDNNNHNVRSAFAVYRHQPSAAQFVDVRGVDTVATKVVGHDVGRSSSFAADWRQPCCVGGVTSSNSSPRQLQVSDQPRPAHHHHGYQQQQQPFHQHHHPSHFDRRFSYPLLLPRDVRSAETTADGSSFHPTFGTRVKPEVDQFFDDASADNIGTSEENECFIVDQPYCTSGTVASSTSRRWTNFEAPPSAPSTTRCLSAGSSTSFEQLSETETVISSGVAMATACGIDDITRRRRRREQNRRAARKCREKKKENVDSMRMAYDKTKAENDQLKVEKNKLQQLVVRLQDLMRAHQAVCKLAQSSLMSSVSAFSDNV